MPGEGTSGQTSIIENELNESKTEMSDLEKQIEAMNSKKETFKTQIKQLETFKGEIQVAVNNYESKYQNFENQITDLEKYREKKNACIEIEWKNSTINEEVEKVIDKVNDEIEGTEGTPGKKGECSIAKEKYEKAKKIFEDARNELESVKKSYEELKNNQQSLDTKIRELTELRNSIDMFYDSRDGNDKEKQIAKMHFLLKELNDELVYINNSAQDIVEGKPRLFSKDQLSSKLESTWTNLNAAMRTFREKEKDYKDKSNEFYKIKGELESLNNSKRGDILREIDKL